MSDRKPVVVALTVGGFALAANGAAVVIAISANSPPEAAAFGIIGLIAAFTGLITTILWAWREDAVKPQPRRERVFTPWVPLAEEREPRLVAARGASPPRPDRHASRRALLATPVPAVGGTVIYLAGLAEDARGTARQRVEHDRIEKEHSASIRYVNRTSGL